MSLPTGNAAIVYLAEALGSFRALSETESRILQRAIVRTPETALRRWTPQEDAQLLKMHKARIRGPDMAVKLNRTETAVYTRIRDLKKAARVK